MKEELSTIQDKDVDIEILQGLQNTFSTEWLFDLADDLTGLSFKGQLIADDGTKFCDFLLVADADGNVQTVTSSTTATNKVLTVDCLLTTVSSKKLQPNLQYTFQVQMYSGAEALQAFIAKVFVIRNKFIN